MHTFIKTLKTFNSLFMSEVETLNINSRNARSPRSSVPKALERIPVKESAPRSDRGMAVALWPLTLHPDRGQQWVRGEGSLALVFTGCNQRRQAPCSAARLLSRLRRHPPPRPPLPATRSPPPASPPERAVHARRMSARSESAGRAGRTAFSLVSWEPAPRFRQHHP